MKLNAKDAGNFTRFINDSYYPNVDGAFIRWNNASHLILFANAPIKKGQQLFIDYGIGYWMARGVLTFLNQSVPSLWQNIKLVGNNKGF